MTAVPADAVPTADQGAALDIARGLVRAGVPVFLAHGDAEGSAGGFRLPPRWQWSQPDEAVIDAWRPGDALCALMGVVLDLVDIDPRDGGTESWASMQAAGVAPQVWAEAATPSGGRHLFVARLRTGSRDKIRPGVDIKGGRNGLVDRAGRGLAYIAPTVRISKLTGVPTGYRWTTPPVFLDENGHPDADLMAALTEDDSVAELADIVQAELGSNVTALRVPGAAGPYAPNAMRTFTTDQAAAYVGAQLSRLAATPSGEINRTLFETSLLMGHFVPGFYDETDAVKALLSALAHTAYDGRTWKAPATIRSGMERGMSEPYTRVDALAQPLLISASPATPAGPTVPTADLPPAVGGPAAVPGSTATPTGTASQDAGDAPAPTWARVDLGVYARGEYVPPTPTLMPRADGACLLYPGLVHSIHGESESGKSWVAQAEAARCLKAGDDVLYVDFESDAGSVVGRLLELGCTVEQILDHLDYRQPEASPASVYELAEWQAMMSGTYVLAVVDGVTDSLSVFGAASNDNDEITTWMRQFPRQLARRTGAAVVLIDHVVKNSEARGRFAIGGQSKMNGLTGAAYSIDVLEPMGRGLRGVLSLRVAKDRPGGVRGIAGEMRKTDRTQEVAHFVLDGSGEHSSATVQVPDGTRKQFRPTVLMERVSQFLAASPGSTGRAVTAAVQGKAEHLRSALTLLVAEDFVKVVERGQAVHYYSIKPYFESDDADRVPASHRVPTASQEPRPASPPPRGGTRTHPRESALPRPDLEMACAGCGEITTEMVDGISACRRCGQIADAS